MDAPQFDHFSKALARLTGRRSLTQALATLSLTGVSGLLAGESAARRKRRGAQAEKKRKKKEKKKPFCLNGQTVSATKSKAKKLRKQGATPGQCPGCTPEAATQTCAGKCGSVTSNCQQTVDCGSCGGCQGLAPDKDLQAAVNATGTGATLTLCEGTWTPPTRVDVNRDMTIRGAGAGKTILDGRNLISLIRVSSPATVTLEHLTITQGKDEDGGGIYIHSGALHLRQVEVTACAATLSGGGIRSNGVLELHEGVHIHNNEALIGGGIRNSAPLTMHNGSRVTGNRAVEDGGGVSNLVSTVLLKSGSRVSGNRAGFGGGISNWSGAVTLQGGSVVGGDEPEDANVAEGYGGGISGYDTILEPGSRVTGNTAGIIGGGCYADLGDWILRAGSEVTGNSAPRAAGIYRSSGEVTLETGAIVCNNLPLNAQCEGLMTGTCPNPGGGVCQA